MPRARVVTFALAILLLAAIHLDAQWLRQPTPGIPRTASGDVDLAAPAPRTADGKPDLSGVWGWQPNEFLFSLTMRLTPDAIKPAARELQAKRLEGFGQDDPSQFKCVPQGPRLNLYAPNLAKIIQTPGLIVILSEDLTFRQIFLDGRALPKDPDPSFMGYSVGRWDGDTLVVDTIGFKDQTWLDFSGLPHSEKLRITERIRRDRFGRLAIEQTVDDPEVFARPFTVPLGAQYVADTDLLEYVCAENEKSKQRFVGTASDELARAQQLNVAVAPESLKKYAGAYDFRFPENPTVPFVMAFRVEAGQLFMGAIPMIPVASNMFVGPLGRTEFVSDSRGTVTHIVLRLAEGDLKAMRMPTAVP
jgi:hypothetical protein